MIAIVGVTKGTTPGTTTVGIIMIATIATAMTATAMRAAVSVTVSFASVRSWLAITKCASVNCVSKPPNAHGILAKDI